MFVSKNKPFIAVFGWTDISARASTPSECSSIWFSHPAVIAASQGNMTQGENYYHGGLLRFDLTPKPAHERLSHLIRERWHTETSARTDARGKATLRGFYGDYEVKVTAKGKTVTQKITLSKKDDRSFALILQ